LEHGDSGPHGLFVTRAVMEAREEDIGSVTIHFLCMVELIVLEIDTKGKTVIQTAVLVSKIQTLTFLSP